MSDKAADLFAHLDWDRDIRPFLSFADIDDRHQMPQSIVWTGALDRRNRRAPIAETACGLTFSPRTVLLALHEMALRPHIPFEDTLRFCLNRNGEWLRARPDIIFSNVMDPWRARFGSVPPAPSHYIDKKGRGLPLHYQTTNPMQLTLTDPSEANIKRLRAYRIITLKLNTVFSANRLDAQ